MTCTITIPEGEYNKLVEFETTWFMDNSVYLTNLGISRPWIGDVHPGIISTCWCETTGGLVIEFDSEEHKNWFLLKAL